MWDEIQKVAWDYTVSVPQQFPISILPDVFSSHLPLCNTNNRGSEEAVPKEVPFQQTLNEVVKQVRLASGERSPRQSKQQLQSPPLGN